MCRLPLNMGTSTSWNPQGLSRPVMGLLYLYLNCAYNYRYNYIFVRCWRWIEKISWTDHMRNEDVLLWVKKQRNILHEIRKRKANWIGHILHRNCLQQRVTEGKIQGGIEVTGRQGRRRRKLLDDLKERRVYSHLKEEVLDRTMWRTRFGRGFGSVVRQTNNEFYI